MTLLQAFFKRSPLAALMGFLLTLLLCVHPSWGAATPVDPAHPKATRVEVVSHYFDANRPDTALHLVQLMQVHPEIQIQMWSGLELPGGGGRAPITMAIAGETAPDIMESWFHIIRNDIDQGFLYPLNEWIGEDKNGDGQISPEEANWKRWKQIPELWRRVATKNGKIYGIPEVGRAMMGVLFRTDMVRNAGLDPNKPPETWEEFYYWCMRLSDPGVTIPGRSYSASQQGIALEPFGFSWIPWIQAAGGEPIIQVRTDPKTGRSSSFPLAATDFHLPDGTDLSREKPMFRADFDSKEGLDAAALFHKLRWGPWIVDPTTGEPVALDTSELEAGEVTVDDHEVRFTPEDVHRGVARAQSGPRDASSMELLARGNVAMMPSFVTGDINLGMSPDLLSWFPFPSINSRTPRVVQVQNHFVTLCVNVGKRPKTERDRVWKVMQAITDKNAGDENIKRMVISGLARFVDPKDLARLGFTDYLRDVPSSIRETFHEIETGQVKAYTEPFEGFWATMDGALNREVLSLILSQSGEYFDYEAALRKVTHDANSGVMFGRSKAELESHRGLARVIFSFILGFVALFLILIVRSLFRKKGELASGMVTRRWLPWLLLFPALLLIGLWGYYPLLKGMVMAFQDFHITGESPWVGLDNFIALAMDRSFLDSLGRTLYYVFISMLFSFTAPIILAVMLSEVPRGKIAYRMLFFLPQVTSGLVVALLWKMMYDPNPSGIFNQIIAVLDMIPGVHIGPQSWLLDPKLAMVCVVLPTTWASAGIQSLIYLAALKSVPEDTYEACEIEGGGIFTKLRHITLPVLMPLIVINFVGAFIGTFQNMGNIFLLTFGGPGETTMVAGMRIWIEAYSNLRFSMATSMAWVVGACLISFTYLQIQFLKRIEFRKSDA